MYSYVGILFKLRITAYTIGQCLMGMQRKNIMTKHSNPIWKKRIKWGRI